jgi:ubiquinone/menaquinone biosynthesis C-methylase UbiE
MKLKESLKVIQKNKIYYILNDELKKKKFKPWLAPVLCFLYDQIMSKLIFPKNFKGSIAKHSEILKSLYQNIHSKEILEIATGSGSTAYLLNNDNSYTGIDISIELLYQAVKKFKKNNFHDAEFFVADANDMPFSNDFFDVTICNLSLQFLSNIEIFIKELKRVMKKDSIFYCSVPLSEIKDIKVKIPIHGNLYSKEELKTYFEKNEFEFLPEPFENGALLYFEAKLSSNELKINP